MTSKSYPSSLYLEALTRLNIGQELINTRLTRMLMSRMLTRLGHQVTTAENGKIALDLINDSYTRKESAPIFDIVFLDK